jgi:hypothetical protein
VDVITVERRLLHHKEQTDKKIERVCFHSIELIQNQANHLPGQPTFQIEEYPGSTSPLPCHGPHPSPLQELNAPISELSSIGLG